MRRKAFSSKKQIGVKSFLFNPEIVQQRGFHTRKDGAQIVVFLFPPSLSADNFFPDDLYLTSHFCQPLPFTFSVTPTIPSRFPSILPDSLPEVCLNRKAWVTYVSTNPAK